jgi:hypothetical protein
MLIKDFMAPDSGPFPVYAKLATRLAEAHEHPDLAVAHVMATCAGYAYSEGMTLSMIMARLGLEGNRCHMISESVEALFISSTCYVLQSNDGRVVVVVYRGAEPASSHRWLTYEDLNPGRVRFTVPGDSSGDCAVHGGFLRNVRVTRAELMASLWRAHEVGQFLPTGLSMCQIGWK